MRDTRTTAQKIEDASAALRPTPQAAEMRDNQAKADALAAKFRSQALGDMLTAPAPQVETVEYKNTKKFDADANARTAAGWSLVHVSSPDKGRRITAGRIIGTATAGVLTGGLAVVGGAAYSAARPKGRGAVVAVWKRG